MLNRNEHTDILKNIFNTIADGYDRQAIRYFPESAKRIAGFLHLKGDELVLDVGTGTGYVALILAKVLPNGHVTGIDFSDKMLLHAIKKQEEQNIRNVTFCEMDMQAITFPGNSFDVAISAFSLFFVKDMHIQLLHIKEKVKQDGRILMTTFFETAFSPLIDLFINQLEQYGINVSPLSWKRVATKAQCINLFTSAGLQQITCEPIECGYVLQNADAWWDHIWYGGFRGFMKSFSADTLKHFKEEHIAQVRRLISDKGVKLEMSILYTLGLKKA